MVFFAILNVNAVQNRQNADVYKIKESQSYCSCVKFNANMIVL